jgi:hypothetical protein
VVLRLGNTQAFGHLFVQEAFSWAVGLDPFAIDDKLRDGTLAGSGNHFVGRSGRVFDVDLREGTLFSCKKRLAVRQSGHQREE